jgi:outer membrane usher protein FimD/PapC
MGTGPGGAVPIGGNEADAAAGKSNLPDKAAVNRSWNTASSQLNGSVSWQAVWDANARGQNASINYQRQPLTRSISASSSVTCNEKKYSSQWTAWFQFGVDFFKTGGGGVDLFR